MFVTVAISTCTGVNPETGDWTSGGALTLYAGGLGSSLTLGFI